jgi:carotenoid cleavage dioxygenase-like enzyme
VISWETRRDVQMAAALDRLRTDLMTGVVWHSGDPVFIEHFGNAYVRRKGGHRLVRKEHDQSTARSTAWSVPRWRTRPAPTRSRPALTRKTLTRVTGRVRSY